MASFDIIDNVLLVLNGLDHIEFEFTCPKTSYFRIARESHLVLYRSMIECLKGSANIAVTFKPSGVREHIYQLGDGPIQRIVKQDVPECAKAWRFSSPETVNSFPESRTQSSEPSEDFLIPFYDALAMIQTECFMQQFIHSDVILVSGDDMATLEWLHESIRNEYEHFVPKLYSAPVVRLLTATRVALTVAKKCLFQSGNVLFFNGTHDDLKHKFSAVLASAENHYRKATI